MPSELVCPRCGTHLPLDLARARLDTPSDAGRTVEAVIPGTIDDTVPPAGIELGNLATRSADEIEPIAFDQRPDDGAPPEIWIADDSNADIPAAPAAEPFYIHDTPHVAEPAPFQVDLASSPAPPAESPATSSADLEPADEPAPKRAGLGMVLLASYASAMTLACAWLLWQARQRAENPFPDTLPADSRPGERSASLAPIPDERATTVGKPLVLDDIEITPGPPRLARVDLTSGNAQRKSGGEGSLLVPITVKNRSKDHTFAPVDAEFVRAPDRGLPESFIESPAGAIELYPLSVSSEWKIVGQDLRELKPGEAMETVIASEPNAQDRLDSAMHLRLKLRSSPDATPVVRVDFDGTPLKP